MCSSASYQHYFHFEPPRPQAPQEYYDVPQASDRIESRLVSVGTGRVSQDDHCRFCRSELLICKLPCTVTQLVSQLVTLTQFTAQVFWRSLVPKSGNLPTSTPYYGGLQTRDSVPRRVATSGHAPYRLQSILYSVLRRIFSPQFWYTFDIFEK